MNILPPASGSSLWVAFYRSRWADNVYRSTSSNGIDWETPKATSLPNPNSGICAARLSSGHIAIVFNRSSTSADTLKRQGLYDDITPEDDKRPNQVTKTGKDAVWGTPRKALTLGVSEDEGLTWRERVLEDGDGFCGTNSSLGQENRELSYRSIYIEKGGDSDVAHVAYTWHRQHIKYVRIDDVEAWVS
ncbi:neuraminidase (sialidase) [Fusarium subglutinans]|uniref:Neuraminidase (Sialidase) n=1 Tax=Gibberella subglutinans TaxID=42677 RepID=A0A8H5L982_GIBSU|nr:neuraminidase (sialidase) [Fusarium subglutinans]KAF5586145.1 neuraminidase (sialidase) [Fusarium subglutinans]